MDSILLLLRLAAPPSHHGLDMLKFCAVLVMVLASSVVRAQSEESCLASGRMAEVVAQLMKNGVSEESLVREYTKPSTEKSKAKRLRRDIRGKDNAAIVNYVYTMRHTPAEARSTVYLKCMAGGLGHIDWSKHPEAVYGD